jgi:hypothetical protein
MSGLA